MKELVHDFFTHLRPPYSRKTLPISIFTVFVLLMIPGTVFLAQNATKLFSRAASDSRVVFVNPDTREPISSITSAEVGVLLTAPWPIAEVAATGEIAGLSIDIGMDPDNHDVLAQTTTKNRGGSGGGKGSGGAGGTGGGPKVNNPPSTNSPPVTAAPGDTQRAVSILLAQDSGFTQNLVTITSITSNPFFTRYTFSDSSPGTKTLYAKFVSSAGTSQVFSSTIQLGTSTTQSTVAPGRPQTGSNRPYPGAPLCPDSGVAHNNSLFHTLWNSARGCHYDHEHGASPFTQTVANAFPGFDLRALQCGKEIGHCNPSSPAENEEAHHGGKHGGMKWQVDTAAPQGCTVGFEGGQIAIDAYAVMHHNLGRQDIEFESRQHSGVFLLRQCKQSNPNDKGYMFVGQLIEYGQRVMPYQGITLPYPNRFMPEYDSARGPYFTTECFGDGSSLGIACRPTFNFGGNNLSIWTSKPTGRGSRPQTSTLAGLLFRSRDNYQRFDVRDMTHPFTWRFVCSSDGGVTYNSDGCRYNNSTTTVQELAGTIPASWDNLAGFDTDPRVGRITAQGFVNRYGTLAQNCTAGGGLDCQPIKMVSAFVGFYSSELSAGKVSNPTPADTPESDIYFCNGVECEETDPGAVPSGWIGQNN